MHCTSSHTCIPRSSLEIQLDKALPRATEWKHGQDALRSLRTSMDHCCPTESIQFLFTPPREGGQDSLFCGKGTQFCSNGMIISAY